MQVAKNILVVAAMLAASGAHGQGLKPTTVVRSLPGWKCMALSSAYGPRGTYASPVPVYAGPQTSAPQIGTSAGVIIVPENTQPTNGRTEIIRPNGQKAWIDVNQLTAWHSLSHPSAVCHPAILSNGRYGFTTTG
jgi:hypothetical protein